MSVAPFRHALEWPACGSLRKCRRLTQHLFNPPNPHKQTVRCLDGKEGRSPPPSPRPASERIRNCSNSAPSRLSKASIRTVLTETLVQVINWIMIWFIALCHKATKTKGMSSGRRRRRRGEGMKKTTKANQKFYRCNQIIENQCQFHENQ